MDYKQFWKICANWSTTSKKSDYGTMYPVVTYTKYAPTFDEFAAKYPFFTIENCFKATSDCLPSNVPGHCETTRFETRIFQKNQNTYKRLIDAHGNSFSCDVGAEVGYGFRSENNILYLNPFINGWIYKCCHPWSCLEFGLSATSITFEPKHPNAV